MLIMIVDACRDHSKYMTLIMSGRYNLVDIGNDPCKYTYSV